MLYGIETAPDAMVSIDRALWRGDIRLIPSHNRTTADRGMIKSATLAADAAIQGIPCRAGALVEFSEYGGDLQHCTLTQRIGVTAEIDEGQGGKSRRISGPAGGGKPDSNRRYRVTQPRFSRGAHVASA